MPGCPSKGLTIRLQVEHVLSTADQGNPEGYLVDRETNRAPLGLLPLLAADLHEARNCFQRIHFQPLRAYENVLLNSLVGRKASCYTWDLLKSTPVVFLRATNTNAPLGTACTACAGQNGVKVAQGLSVTSGGGHSVPRLYHLRGCYATQYGCQLAWV